MGPNDECNAHNHVWRLGKGQCIISRKRGLVAVTVTAATSRRTARSTAKPLHLRSNLGFALQTSHRAARRARAHSLSNHRPLDTVYGTAGRMKDDAPKHDKHLASYKSQYRKWAVSAFRVYVNHCGDSPLLAAASHNQSNEMVDLGRPESLGAPLLRNARSPGQLVIVNPPRSSATLRSALYLRIGVLACIRQRSVMAGALLCATHGRIGPCAPVLEPLHAAPHNEAKCTSASACVSARQTHSLP